MCLSLLSPAKQAALSVADVSECRNEWSGAAMYSAGVDPLSVRSPALA